MREFCQIRDQKKTNSKIIYRFRNTAMFPNGNIGGFQSKLLKPIYCCLFPMQNNQSNQLMKAHGTFPNTWQRLIYANAPCILRV